ncbi:MAG: AsmA family protein [Dongiaceae bacterium]
MRVLAFASQKAGAGKTTLAGHIAVQAQKSGSVAVIDVDPEAHLADWCAKRADQPLRHVHATQAELLQKIEALRSEGIDLAVIDTPPALSHSIETVLRAADLVAIPTRPYGHDLNAANATAELARQAGKPFVFIVNGAQADAELPADLVMTLAQFGPVATTSIPRSLAFVDAMIEGRTVSDSGAEEAAAGTVAQLWKYLAKKLPKAAKAGRSKSIAADAAAAEAPPLFTAKAPTRKAETLPLADEAPVTRAPDDIADEANEPEASAPVLKVPARRPPPPKQEQNSEPVAMTAANPPPPQTGRRRSRWRLVKIGLAAGVSLVLLAGVAAIVAVSNIDPRTYAGLITTAVEEATGRKLEINGDIDIALGLTPGVVIEDITLSNAKWSQQPLMASAKRLEVDIRLLPLLFGDVKIRRIILTGAQVNLERAADGKDNWTFAASAEPAPADAGGESGLPEIHQVRIEDSRFVFDDQAAKEHREAEIGLLKLTADGLDQVLEFDLAGAIDGQPLKAEGEIDSLKALMDGGDLAIDVELQSGESRLAAEGSIEAPYFAADMELNIEGSGPTLAEIGRPFGIALAERGPFKISGALSGGDKQYKVDELDASVAQSDLKGNAALDFRGERPNIIGALQSNHLDLSDILGDEPAAEPAAAEPDDGRLFSDDRIPFDAIKAVDGDLTIDVKSFVSNSVELKDVTGHVVLANGVATLSPFRAGISGGQLVLSSVVNAVGKTPVVTLRTNADGISGNDLLGLLGLDGVLGGGSANLALDLNGQGDSLRDLMGTLGGAAQLHMAGGYVNNDFARFLLADMTQMIATAGQGGAGVSCLVTSFDVKNGVATSKKTVIDAPGAAIVGSGKINLRKETIGMRFEPVAKQIGLSQFAVPVDVVGALGSPSVRPDAVAGATGIVGTTAALATDNVLGVIGSATGLATGQASTRGIPSCGAPAPMPATATVTPEVQLAPAEETALPEGALVEPAPAVATEPAATTNTTTTAPTTTTTKPKQKATASSSDESTLDKAGNFLGNVGSSIDGLFEGTTSTDTSNATKGK